MYDLKSEVLDFSVTSHTLFLLFRLKFSNTPIASNKVIPYIGIGSGSSTFKGHIEYTTDSGTSNGETKKKFESDDWSAENEMEIKIGVEWFIAQNVSFFCEYRDFSTKLEASEHVHDGWLNPGWPIFIPLPYGHDDSAKIDVRYQQFIVGFTFHIFDLNNKK
jgi:opacity protein-like surface antigen